MGAEPSFDDPDICAPCGLKLRTRKEAERAKVEQISRKYQEATTAQSIIKLTTAFTIANAEIETEIAIVTAECAFGMNVFRDIFAVVRDLTGGRSKATQNVLRDARLMCLEDLRNEAEAVGADAVIGVDLDYSELSGGGKSMLFLVASGTAVKLKT